MIIELLDGAAIMAAGVIIGRFLPARRRRPRNVQPVCGCRHHRSFHDPKTGECHGTVNGEPIAYYSSGVPSAYKQVRCSCRQYNGPVPLPETYAPELAG